MDDTRPVVRLRPKAGAQAIRHGFPWVYDNELVVDRRTKALEPGTIAVLEDNARLPMATVAVNPGSRLIARVLDVDSTATIDPGWIEAGLARALEHRKTLFENDYYRWIHAEGDGFPGLVIDRFGDVVVVQPNAAWIERKIEDSARAIRNLAPEVTCIVKNAGGRTRKLEGLDDQSGVLFGAAPDLVPVPMNGATYMADLLGGQKTGLFYDQRPNHAFFQRLSKGGSVLDVFSHVGGFGLAALAGGARAALCVDGSAAALDLAAQGAAHMGESARFEARRGDAFDVLTALAQEGRVFDAVVCDPPAFAPSKQALTAGLRAYEKVARLAAPLVAPGGYLTLCSCSHAADLTKFLAASSRGIGRAGRQAGLIHTGFAGPDHPQLPQLGEVGYLKALFFRLN